MAIMSFINCLLKIQKFVYNSKKLKDGGGTDWLLLLVLKQMGYRV